jgi:hypothetical protein
MNIRFGAKDAPAQKF